MIQRIAPDECQQNVIDSLMGEKGQNVVLVACAGSGKSTTALSLAQRFPEKNFLCLTFNNFLAVQFREDVVDWPNIQVFTFHAFCHHHFDNKVVDDFDLAMMVDRLRKNNGGEMCPCLPSSRNYLQSIDVLCLDEAEDLSNVFVEWVITPALMNMGERKVRILLLGDPYQDIYHGLKKTNVDYILDPERMWCNYLHPLAKQALAQAPEQNWARCYLDKTYRLLPSHVEMVTQGLRYLVPPRMQSARNDEVVSEIPSEKPLRYLAGTIDTIVHHTLQHMRQLFQSGISQSKTIILAFPQLYMKNGLYPLPALLSRTFIHEGIPCTIVRPQENMVIQPNTIYIMSWHKSRGLTADIVYVMNFQATSLFGEDSVLEANTSLPNPSHVAVTRSRGLMVIVHVITSKQESKLPHPSWNLAWLQNQFVNSTIMTFVYTDSKLMELILAVGNQALHCTGQVSTNNDIGDNLVLGKRGRSANTSIDRTVTQLCSYLSVDFINQCHRDVMSCFEKVEEVDEEYSLEVKVEGKISNKLTNQVEQIRDYYGIAIGMYVNHALIESAEKAAISNTTRTMRFRGIGPTHPSQRSFQPLGKCGSRWDIPLIVRTALSSWTVPPKSLEQIIKDHKLMVQQLYEEEELEGEYSLRGLLYFAFVDECFKRNELYRLGALPCQLSEMGDQWLPENVDTAVLRRVQSTAAKNVQLHFPEFEVAVDASVSVLGDTFNVVGRCDAITDSILWEWKYTNRLAFEHFVQLALYQFLYDQTYKKQYVKEFHLLNFGTGEHWRICKPEEMLLITKEILLPALLTK